jgi:hypothetical protein
MTTTEAWYPAKISSSVEYLFVLNRSTSPTCTVGIQQRLQAQMVERVFHEYCGSHCRGALYLADHGIAHFSGEIGSAPSQKRTQSTLRANVFKPEVTPFSIVFAVRQATSVYSIPHVSRKATFRFVRGI